MNNLKQKSLMDVTLNGPQKDKIYSLNALQNLGINISRLPYSIRILLESALRNFDNKKITENHLRALIGWEPNGKRESEVPFIASRVILQDYTGVPLLADLAAMRECASKFNLDPKVIEPLVPVDLVIDHSVQTNYTGTPNAINLNMELEFKRNDERYSFMKWGSKAFQSFSVIEPGIGIVHQVNLEYLAKGVFNKDGIYYPDSVIGTDSHTTMINGLGIVGWGVGGIEAEAAMLGQPVYMLMPDVVGVHLKGKPQPGITATDIVLTLTEILRKENVVGKFIEYYGEGAKTLSVPDRATIANMAPDYGATMGLFHVDEKTIEYYKQTGRDSHYVDQIDKYYKAQSLFDMDSSLIEYSKVISIDLNVIIPCISGPRRPQERISLEDVKSKFSSSLTSPISELGYGKSKIHDEGEIKDGDIFIAGITSCTNTSNPSVLIAAGLLAKNAFEQDLKISRKIKSSITPGSRAVTEYLKKAGLQYYLDKMGFYTAGYGCTTCIGNVGEIDKEFEQQITDNNIIACSVLSGNRNFEARIHPALRANFLMSPPLVVAFAIAGNINKDLTTEPLGINKNNEPVYLKDIWPTNEEIDTYLSLAQDSQIYREIYYNNKPQKNELWENLECADESVFKWNDDSLYIAKPPFLDGFSATIESIQDIVNARCLAMLGDSITTDHISPAGDIDPGTPAGTYLLNKKISKKDFNSFGARRGHHEIMTRGTFSNVRLKNMMVKGVEGGLTIHYPSKEMTSIYEASVRYRTENTPVIIFAGKEYGTGSSRDWAAKGTNLLGVKAIIAESFERIHRSNLVGMGILPCQFIEGMNLSSLKLIGSERIDIINVNDSLTNRTALLLIIHRENGIIDKIPLLCRLDTEIESEYFKNGGILPYMMRNILSIHANSK